MTERAMASKENPIVELDAKGRPVVEMKAGLVLYAARPPGPKTARKAYDLFMARCGDKIQRYGATVPNLPVRRWTAQSKKLFEEVEIHELRKYRAWGYGFDDGQTLDSTLFMFHGARPITEAGKASLYRFEFPWNIPPDFLWELAREVVDTLPFHAGFGGWFLQFNHRLDGYDRMYAYAQRYWAVEAYNPDVTMDFILAGYKSVNWLTFIGADLV
ncbi:MAG: type VI immunity family protein, partial [Nannocystaceae bacterium]